MSAKTSPRKTAKDIQAALPQNIVLLRQRAISRRLCCAILKSYRPAKKPKLS